MQSSTIITTALLLLVVVAHNPSTAFISLQVGSSKTSQTRQFAGKNKGRQTNIPKPLPTGPPPQDIGYVHIIIIIII